MRPQKPKAETDAGQRREGFTLVLALLVLALLTTLGLSVLFVAETEVAVSRNYASSIQAIFEADAQLRQSIPYPVRQLPLPGITQARSSLYQEVYQRTQGSHLVLVLKGIIPGPQQLAIRLSAFRQHV